VKLVLEPEDWRAAHLEDDADAVAWADSLGHLGRNSILSLELVGEGRLAYHEIPRSRSDLIYRTNPCRARDLIYIRRYHAGPVPPQVLAAFRPRP
jgi:hypothetical protein